MSIKKPKYPQESIHEQKTVRVENSGLHTHETIKMEHDLSVHEKRTVDMSQVSVPEEKVNSIDTELIEYNYERVIHGRKMLIRLFKSPLSEIMQDSLEANIDRIGNIVHVSGSSHEQIQTLLKNAKEAVDRNENSQFTSEEIMQRRMVLSDAMTALEQLKSQIHTPSGTTIMPLPKRLAHVPEKELQALDPLSDKALKWGEEVNQLFDDMIASIESGTRKVIDITQLKIEDDYEKLRKIGEQARKDRSLFGEAQAHTREADFNQAVGEEDFHAANLLYMDHVGGTNTNVLVEVIPPERLIEESDRQQGRLERYKEELMAETDPEKQTELQRIINTTEQKSERLLELMGYKYRMGSHHDPALRFPREEEED
jgi:hypothetical protein